MGKDEQRTKTDIGDVVIAQLDDWVGIYKDGKIVDQGHSFSGITLLSALGVEYEYLPLYDYEDVFDGIHLPDTITELHGMIENA